MNSNQFNDNQKWDVVVLGGGIAGLTASIYLAQAGKRVLVLEKAPKLGGRGITNKVGNAQLNLGPHALYTNCLEILNEVGVNVSGKLPKLSGSFVFGDKQETMKVVEALNLFIGNHLKWKEKMEFIRFYRHIRKLDIDTLNEISLDEYLTTMVSSKQVRELIKAFVRVSTFTNNPEIISARVAIGQLRSAKVIYVNEGWQSIVDDLATRAIQLGVTIKCNAIVTEISGSFPTMNINLKEKDSFSAECILSTINPHDLVKLVNEQPSATFVHKYKTMIPVRAACLDLVMTGLPNPKLNFALGVDKPWYFSNHSTVAKLSDKPEEHVIHVMKYLDSLIETDPIKDEQELEGFLDVIQPGWRKFVISRRFLPKLLVSNAIKTPSNDRTGDDLNQAEIGIDGLFVAGDWVEERELLLSASLTSTKNAIKLINEKLTLQPIYK